MVLADCLVEAGKLDEALRDYTTALEWVNNAIRRSGFQTWTRIDLAAVHAGRAVALHRLSRFSDALADWDKAIDFASEFARGDATQFASYPYNLYTGKAETLTRLKSRNRCRSDIRPPSCSRSSKSPIRTRGRRFTPGHFWVLPCFYRKGTPTPSHYL